MNDRPTVVTVDGSKIVVACSRELDERIGHINGARFYKARAVWTFPASPYVADELAAALRGVPNVTADDGVKELRAESARRRETAHLKYDDDLPPIPNLERIGGGWAHQRQAFWFAREMPDAICLDMGMGTGKSLVGVKLLDEWQPESTLVVCPKNVVGVWPREHAKWAATTGVRIIAPRRGPRGGALSGAQRADIIGEGIDAATRAGQPFVVVVHYDAVWRGDLRDILLGRKWSVGLADEVHRVKSPGGKQSKFMEALARRQSRRLGLTGTLLPHSPLDIFGQYRYLDPGIFGTSFVDFRARYAVVVDLDGAPIVRSWQNQQELSEKIHRIAIRIPSSVLDLPDVVNIDKLTELSPKGQRVYDEMRKELIAWVEDERDAGTVTAANALTKVLRLQQVTSGLMPLDDPDLATGARRWVEVDTAKRSLLAETIADIDTREPIVVCCRFTADLDNVEYVARKQGRRYMELSGRRNDGLTDDALMHPECDVLGVQIKAGGVGIDLTRSHTVVNYSTGYSLGDWEQWKSRTHRPGQTETVTYYNLACEGTIDEAVYAALDSRKALVDFVLGLAKDQAATDLKEIA